ncbi:MAG: MlaD family protein [Bacteroidota bacterium]
MESRTENFKIRLGLFITGGFLLFLTALFYIGRQKHLFNTVINVHTKLKNVSGLQIGNNVRYAGINVGTVDNISITNDTSVRVDMIIDDDVKHFIKTDCIVLVGSDGIIGDRVVNIAQGEGKGEPIKQGSILSSNEPVETDAIMASFQVTVENAEIISGQLAAILFNLNQGNGALGKLLKDTSIATNLDETMENLRQSSKGLNENMNAAKNSFLLKGYFRKKDKEKAKEKEKKEIQQNPKSN